MGSENSGTLGTGVLKRPELDGWGACCGAKASSAFGAKVGCGLNSETGEPKGELVAGCGAGGVCPSNWALLKPESVGGLAVVKGPVDAKGSNGFGAAIRGPVGCATGWLAKADDAGGAPKV